MARTSSKSSPVLTDLVAYLFTQREAILNNWRTACENDRVLSNVSAMSRQEFNDLMPVILDILEQRLLEQPPEVDLGIAATSHGLHRWQKSHDLLETMQELDHLTKILYNELQSFQSLFPETEASLLLHVQRTVGELMSETIQGSIRKYDELQRLEAANRASALQEAINQMNQLARQRGDMLKTSSHDLRSSFGLIKNAAYLLKMNDLPEEERSIFLDMLNRNLSNVQTMLSSLMDLSRLEAGEETLNIQSVNAAELLREMVASAQALAKERGLIIRADGPDPLLVNTDSVKLQRIVQNILVNALQHTSSGFISISWSKEGEDSWLFGIQDSGTGLDGALTGLLVKQLNPTVDPTSTLSPEDAQPVAVLPTDSHEIPAKSALSKLAGQSAKGEGVGLQIVKRLCELLGADLGVETHKGRGTLFRIRMPIHVSA